MRIKASALSSIWDLEKIGRSRYSQQMFLYPFLFQEFLYGIAYNHFVHESKYGKDTTSGLNNGFHFFKLKRLIKKLHHSDLSYIISKKSINKIQFVQRVLMIIINLTPYQTKDQMKRTNEWNSYQSVHSVFPFIEDRISNSMNYLNITLPPVLHPEFLIRIFRKDISDVSFLHSSRFLLHRNKFLTNSNMVYLEKNLFHRFLWNFYIHSIEYYLIYLWDLFYWFQPTSFWFVLNRMDFIRKIRYFLKQSKSQIIENSTKRICSIHYVRYRNNLMLATDGNIESIENWKNFFMISFDQYLHSWFEPDRISVRNSNNNPLSILGYVLHAKNDLISFQIQLLDHLVDTSLVIQGFCGVIPITSSIGLLNRIGFCDALGHPVCKLSWTTLTDNEILDRFNRMMKNTYNYYGGCRKKKGLYRLQYIFRFSCAKTLACKHKSTIRNVWKRYGSDFVTSSVFLKDVESIPSNSWRRDSNEKRFWRLNITQTILSSDLLHKSKKYLGF
jgi:hypothetical protein